MNQELASLIDSIRNIPMNDKLSDDAVIALSRSYISMQNLVVANGLDSEYGNRKEFEKALDILYGICCKRCRSSQPFDRRSRMIPVLYSIVYMRMQGVELCKSDECEELMAGLINEWIERPEAHGEHPSVYGVLRCISDLFYYVAAEDRNSNEVFLGFKQRIRDWVARMDDAGQWSGISAWEALCRLEIMSRDSYMFLDTSHDAVIERSRTGYCKSVLEGLRGSNGMLVQNSGLLLLMLYEVMMWGIAAPDYEQVNAIVDRAKRLAEQYPHGSDGWLLYQSTYLDRLCMQVGREMQN